MVPSGRRTFCRETPRPAIQTELGQMAQRQSFLIDPKVQWALTRRILMHWACLLVGLVVLSTVGEVG